MTGHEIIKILKQNGWVVLRINGSHYRLGKENLRTTVPSHSKKDLGKGLIAAIEKQTKLKFI